MHELVEDPIDKFISSLEKELRLRKQELTNVWFYSKQEENDLKKHSLLRNNVLIIYAHWEGFIKSSSVKYIEYICKRNICCESLTLNFKALHIKKISKNNHHNTEWERFKHIASETFVDIFEVKSDVVIETESNLNSDVLIKIIAVLNIAEFGLDEKQKTLIDKGLLKDRNAIAHGELKNVPLSRVEIYHHVILELLECYKDKLIDMVTSELYLESKNI